MSQNKIAEDYRYYPQPVEDVYLEQTPAEFTPYKDKTVPVVDEDAGVIAYAHESLAPFIAEALNAVVFIRQELEKGAMGEQNHQSTLDAIAAIINTTERLNTVDIEVTPAS